MYMIKFDCSKLSKEQKIEFINKLYRLEYKWGTEDPEDQRVADLTIMDLKKENHFINQMQNLYGYDSNLGYPLLSLILWSGMIQERKLYFCDGEAFLNYFREHPWPVFPFSPKFYPSIFIQSSSLPTTTTNCPKFAVGQEVVINTGKSDKFDGFGGVIIDRELAQNKNGWVYAIYPTIQNSVTGCSPYLTLNHFLGVFFGEEFLHEKPYDPQPIQNEASEEERQLEVIKLGAQQIKNDQDEDLVKSISGPTLIPAYSLNGDSDTGIGIFGDKTLQINASAIKRINVRRFLGTTKRALDFINSKESNSFTDENGVIRDSKTLLEIDQVIDFNKVKIFQD